MRLSLRNFLSFFVVFIEVEIIIFIGITAGRSDLDDEEYNKDNAGKYKKSEYTLDRCCESDESTEVFALGIA